MTVIVPIGQTTGKRTGWTIQRRRESDAADVLHARMISFKAAAGALIQALRTHRDITPDFRHWARDLEQILHHTIASCDMAECDECRAIAFHLSPAPGDFSRFCADHFEARFPDHT